MTSNESNVEYVEVDIHKTLCELQERLSKLEITNNSAESDSSEDEADIFPLTSIIQLRNFEFRLSKEKSFRKKMEKSISKLLGSESDNKKAGNFIMNYCFHIQVLQKISYTGISKNPNISPKPAFSQYRAIIHLIFTAIYQADNTKTYNMMKTEGFLQMYFKHVCEKYNKRPYLFDHDDIHEGPTRKYLKRI
ncbi:uncharacterized protein LOC116351960 [Contarinia nasturtii]|uniref:uncharacterized protein LOC116351960 n=1 Tax=Contarinia nasturtii TaxID=265458 RepID=UPI0012D4B4A3|nr:uncharacterized protein LOC116351960 [Contarinia nasturtii]